jgi:hypothetical protein
MLFSIVKKMKTITRYNYETFLVDYWDGNLSPILESELLSFLNENPDIRSEVEGVGNFSLASDKQEFRFKDELKKPEIDRTNIDEFLVAELEGQLLPHQENELNLFIISNQEFERDRRLYALTIVKAEAGLAYPYKRALEKGKTVQLWIRYGSVAAAACLILAMSAIWSLSRKKIDIPGTFVKNEPVSSPSQRSSVPSPDIIVSTQELDLVPPVSKKRPDLIVKTQLIPVPENREIPLDLKQVRHTNNYAVNIPVSNATENFYSYSRNRKPDDYLQGLVNSEWNNGYMQSYMPEQTQLTVPPIYIPEEKSAIKRGISKLTTGVLKLIFHDEEFLSSISADDKTSKVKLAEAFAFATAKVSKGKLKVNSILNDDGTLSALSFSSGRYSYLKKF